MSAAMKKVTDALIRNAFPSAGQTGETAGLYKNRTDTPRVLPRKSTVSVSPNNAEFIHRENVSEEELRRRAEEYADGIYRKSVEELNTGVAGKLNTLNRRLNESLLKGRSAAERAADDYAGRAESIADDAVRQGMVHSSVFSGRNAAARSRYEAETKALNEALAVAAGSIREEIALINASKETALRDYDLKRAADYEKKLASLRAEELAAREEVSEYNKRLAELEAEYENNRARTVREWEDARARGLI